MASEVPFTKVRKMMKQAGYQLARVHGSHHIFTKPGEQPFSIPVHRKKVKAFYVRQVEKIVGGD